MSVTHVVGVDPGLVHTGVVSLAFFPDTKAIVVRDYAIAGPDAARVAHMIGATKTTTFNGPVDTHVFIEKYQPRSHLNTDAEMTKAVLEMKQALPGSQVLLNTGVKKVVKKTLMELLGVWKFSTVTHHQDLRSAARIAILGMLKDEQMNRLIADIVQAHLRGRSWDVRH